MTRGEMWWVEHPDLGRRPYLVLTRSTAIPVLNAVLSVPATTTIRDIATEVLLDAEDGMPTRCALSLDNIALISKTYFRQRIARLTSERMRDVCRALAIATGCE